MISEGGSHLNYCSRLAIFMVIMDDSVPLVCSVPQLKMPSQCLHLNGETPGPAWRRLANPNPNLARILSLLSPTEYAPRTQWKNIPCFFFLFINTVSIL